MTDKHSAGKQITGTEAIERALRQIKHPESCLQLRTSGRSECDCGLALISQQARAELATLRDVAKREKP